jgi:hypothetical protein
MIISPLSGTSKAGVGEKRLRVDGWRAQFAYPYDVVLFGGDEKTARELRRRYAVDVALA